MSVARPPALFESPQAFSAAFEAGLERLLDIGDLNLFILVTANAGFDAKLFTGLRDRLRRHYQAHATRLREVFANGGHVAEADDDLLVFLKIATIGFDALALTEQRQAGIWEVQFNHLRSFRPLRNSQRPMTSIREPFEPSGFNFNKPFMQQEALWSGDMLGKRLDLYYNKYPFVDLHCLLVPERERCLPQYHREEMHEFVWRLVEGLGVALPGVRVGYNALGAFASVNHLHFQLCVRTRALAVEHACWRHNGGDRVYPVDCQLFSDCGQAWAAIERLHAQNLAYNLLYTPRGLYCMVREKQGGFALAEWSNGFSWFEMSGGMITSNHRDFASLEESTVTAGLARAKLD